MAPTGVNSCEFSCLDERRRQATRDLRHRGLSAGPWGNRIAHHERQLETDRVPPALRHDVRPGRGFGRHPPRPGAGGAGAEQQAEHRRDRGRRHGDRQPEVLRGREHRRPVRRRQRLLGEDRRAFPEGQVLQGLPGDARQGEGHRRGDHRDAGSHPRRHHDGGPGGRQARVLPEAADAHGGRGPQDHRGGAPGRRRHPDGQPGPLLRVDARAQGVARRRRHRRRHRGPRLDRPPGGRRPVVGLRPDGPAEGHAAGAGDAGLGPVARPCSLPAVPSRVPPDEVARLGGLRHRPARRHGLPHPRSRLLGARAGRSEDGPGRPRPTTSRTSPRRRSRARPSCATSSRPAAAGRR